MRTIEASPGSHLLDVLAEAVSVANASGELVEFDFNDTKHTAEPCDTLVIAKARAERLLGHRLLTPEEMLEKMNREAAERDAKYQADLAATGAMNEVQMREAKVPTPDSPEALALYVQQLVERPHDYGTCCYAMSMAAVAAMNFVASKLGVTGFQASCADMDILTRRRGYKHGFRIADYGNLLYPQYWKADVQAIYDAALAEHPDVWAKEAARLLSEPGGAEEVREHWNWIVGQADPDSIAAAKS